MTLVPHPSADRIAFRLTVLARHLDSRLEAEVYRFINPKFSQGRDVVSGVGALHALGRWNGSKSFRLSYTSLAPEAALAEVLAQARYYRLPLVTALPKVLVSLRFSAARVLDLREKAVCDLLEVSRKEMVAVDWRAANQGGKEALTQALGRACSGAGFEGVIVPSAALRKAANVLVFPENLQADSRFELLTEVQFP